MARIKEEKELNAFEFVCLGFIPIVILTVLFLGGMSIKCNIDYYIVDDYMKFCMYKTSLVHEYELLDNGTRIRCITNYDLNKGKVATLTTTMEQYNKWLLNESLHINNNCWYKNK